MVNVARSKEGGVERVETYGGGVRVVPLTTVAWLRSWKDGLKALFKLEAAHVGFSDFDKIVGFILVAVCAPIRAGRSL